MKHKHLKAILTKLEGQRDEQLADLEVYLTKPVGVGEHANIGEEIEKKIEKIDDINGKISVIKDYFSTPQLLD